MKKAMWILLGSLLVAGTSAWAGAFLFDFPDEFSVTHSFSFTMEGHTDPDDPLPPDFPGVNMFQIVMLNDSNDFDTDIDAMDGVSITWPGWDQTFNNGSLAILQGPVAWALPEERTPFYVTINLEDGGFDESGNLYIPPFEFEISAYLDSDFIWGEYNSWLFDDPEGWFFKPIAAHAPASPTPEPLSMIMLGCLGGGMALARRLRRK